MKSMKVQEFLRQNSTRIPGCQFPQISVVQAAVAVEQAEQLRDEAAAVALSQICQNRAGDRCLGNGAPCDLKCSLIETFQEKIKNQ